MHPVDIMLGSLTFGDVPDISREQAVFAQARFSNLQFDRNFIPIGKLGLNYTANADNLFHAGTYIVREVAIMVRLILTGHQQANILTCDLSGRIAKQSLCRRTEGDNLPSFVNDDHGVWNRQKDRLQQQP